MANGHGGIRAGQGRKPKAIELKLAETIDTALGEEWTNDVLKEVFAKAKAGSFLHAQLLLAYKYGKPPDKLDVTSAGKALKQVTGMIIK